MNAEPQGDRQSTDETVSQVGNLPVEAGEPSRADMESSVLDALRPLLRGRRKKSAAEAGDAAEADAEAALEAGEADAEADAMPPVFAEREHLERRSRQSATLVRLLEQHRQQLLTAERERDAAYDQLARIVPVVHETARTLREAMDARKVEDDTARMHKLFMMNGRALDELEKVATTLFADFLWVKSAWEQYARSVEDARKLRSGLDN
jgi:hypothetical protein